MKLTGLEAVPDGLCDPGQTPFPPACKCRTRSTFPKAVEKSPECNFSPRADTASSSPGLCSAGSD